MPSIYDSVEKKSHLKRDLMDPPKVKVSAPRHICSLFQDVNELFQQILEPYPSIPSTNNNITILTNSVNMEGLVNLNNSQGVTIFSDNVPPNSSTNVDVI